MPSPDWEDLNVFFDEFADIATINLADETVIENVKCIYDDPYFNAQLGEYDMDTSRPRITCKMSDVTNVSRGDTLTIKSKTYDILTSPQGDGTGLAMLDLAPQAE